MSFLYYFQFIPSVLEFLRYSLCLGGGRLRVCPQLLIDQQVLSAEGIAPKRYPFHFFYFLYCISSSHYTNVGVPRGSVLTLLYSLVISVMLMILHIICIKTLPKFISPGQTFFLNSRLVKQVFGYTFPPKIYKASQT